MSFFHDWDKEHLLWFWMTGNRVAREHLAADKVAALEATPGWTWDVSADDREAFERDAALVRLAQALGSLPPNVRSHAASIPGWRWEDREMRAMIEGLRADRAAGRLSDYDVRMAEQMPGWTW